MKASYHFIQRWNKKRSCFRKLRRNLPVSSSNSNDWSTLQLLFIRPIARVGSGDPVRVLRLYTTITLDEVCSIYCWDICTTCRYRSTCYSTCAERVLSSASSDRLLALNTTEVMSARSRTVLYNAFYGYLCRRYWNGILGPSSPPLPGESFDTCSKAVVFTLADTQVF